jgi:hypothetical protein
MRKKLKNLKNKSGHSENGAPRQLLDEAAYREAAAKNAGLTGGYDSEYSGGSNPSRPQDQAVTLRSRNTPPDITPPD